MNKKKSIKFLSCVLAIVMLLGVLPLYTFAVGEQEPISILYNGEKITELVLYQDDKLTLDSATSLDGVLFYQWQILVNDSTQTWVNISGMVTASCDVTYALVGSLLDHAGKTQLRCRVSDGTDTYFSDPVTVTVSFTARESVGSAYDAQPQAVPKLMSLRSATPLADDDVEVKDVYNIVINYLYKDGSIARDPTLLSFAADTSVKMSIPAPTVVGYDPVLQEAYPNVSLREETVEGRKTVNVDLDYAALDAPKTINVLYHPAIVTYTVHHHRQNLLDDNYESTPYMTTVSEGRTGESVGDCHIDIEGFYPLAYERMTIAADGSTQVEIYYDRNYYLVDFDLGGGYGLEPIYTRYGSEISVNTPTRPGYTFSAWSLVSFNGNPPTAEQIGEFLFTESKTTVEVKGKLSYLALWELGYTSYTMVFWQENANDDGYSYWGSLKVDTDTNGNALMMGSNVSAQDWISRVDGIDDEQYFTYNAIRSDHDVPLKGDGSTIVNVYYQRNRYTINFVAAGVCALDEGHTHAGDCYIPVCGKEHVHSASCERNLTCTVEEHIQHTSSCVSCGLQEHIHGKDCEGATKCGMQEHAHSAACCTLTPHVHSTACYPNVGASVTRPGTFGSFPTPSGDGYIYRYSFWGSASYYIYIGGQWYRYNGTASNGTVISRTCGIAEEHTHSDGTCQHCNLTEHTHTDECLNCTVQEHTHTDTCFNDELHTHGVDCYEYPSCERHVHTDECMYLVCGMTTGHTHTSSCDQANRESTVKVMTRKYQQSLTAEWPITDNNGVTYEAARWMPGNDSAYYSQVLVHISSMPADDFTLTLDRTQRDLYVMHYMLEVLPGEEYTHEYDGKYFVEDFVIKASYGMVTEAEDFFAIKGFENYASDPAFRNEEISLDGGGDVYFYYTRNRGDHMYLSFHNVNEVVKTYAGDNLMYGVSLGDYRYDENGELYVPPYPGTLEPNAFRFDQWYTTPGCYPGTEVNWDTLTMPDGALTVYAKWLPVFHTVNIYQDATLSKQIGPTLTVEHGTFLADPGHPSNGNLVFAGWFYTDDNGVEKAFIFNGIPVKDSMNIYAKWSSRVTVTFTIYYKTIDENGTEINVAPPTEGSTIAGQNRTFSALGGDKLYEEFREGYFPDSASHSIVMSAEKENTHTFYYTKKTTAAYTVKYLDENGNELAPEKHVDNNRYSVVTETFVPITGYMPDSYQKRLVVSADESQNVLIFVYQKDSAHAFCHVVHYTQNLDKNGYTEHSYTDIKAAIGHSCSVSPLLITGFDFAEARVDGVLTGLDSEGKVSGTLEDTDGMVIAFYYTRKTVEYTVEYVEHGNTGKQLADSVTKTGTFGALVEESALDLTDKGYQRVSEQMMSITLKENGNKITFQYQEDTARYHYVAVKEGVLDTNYGSANVSALTGTATGFKPVSSSEYTFEGWFKDAGCTKPVDPATDPVTVDPFTGELTPQKVEKDGISLYVGATYYAKFSYNFATLTIEVEDCNDEEQTFLFLVESLDPSAKESVKLTVAVKGNSSVTIDDIAIGEYRVTQISDWSWRYQPQGGAVATGSVTFQGSNTVTFNQTEQNAKWLNGCGYMQILIP